MSGGKVIDTTNCQESSNISGYCPNTQPPNILHCFGKDSCEAWQHWYGRDAKGQGQLSHSHPVKIFFPSSLE